MHQINFSPLCGPIRAYACKTRHRLLYVSFFLFFFSLLRPHIAAAQITITYPSSAGGLTHGYGQSNLMVQLGFTSACTGSTVTVSLPPSVTYVAGSVSQTASTISGSAITESNISNLNAPVFSLSGITGPGNITFRIARKAGCGNLASGKDTIRVTGSCGTMTENGPNTNVYNILSPVLSLMPPVPVINANVGDVFNRNTVVTNGGNGCADTVVFYIVQSSASLQSNSVTVGGLPVTSFAGSGDTTWYKVYGSQLSADNLFCNGESFTVVNNVRVLNCANLNASYGAGWGTDAHTVCQAAAGSSVINLNSGQPLLVGTADATAIPTCANGRRTFTFSVKNTGTTRAYNIAFSGIGMVEANTGAYVDTAGVMITLPGINGGVPFHPGGINAWGIIGAGCAAGKPQSYYFPLPAGYSLAPGDSIVVVHDAVQCSSSGGACGEAVNTNWSRIHWTYNDQCGNALPYSYTGVYPTMNALNTGLSGRQFPAMINPGDCFNYSFNAGFGSNYLTANGYKEIRITVPSGTTLNTLTEQSGMNPIAGYPVQIADTIIVRFNADSGTGNMNYILKLNLCRPAIGGPCGNQPVSVQARWTRDTTCADPLISMTCGADVFNYLGCPGPCPDGGAGLIRFAYRRTTYGRPDNDNDGRLDAGGSIDLNKIELDRYRPADVMKTHYVAGVSTTATNPAWSYMFSEWTFPAGKWQAQGTATIGVWKSGVALYTLTGIPVNDISSGAGIQFSADWSTQLAAAAPGFSYSETTVDSVVIDASFRFVSGVVPYSTTIPGAAPSLTLQSANQPHNTQTTGQLSQDVYMAQADPAITRFSCLTARYNYYLAGEEVVAWGGAYPGGNLLGCGVLATTYRFHAYVAGATPARYFPYEYRPMAPPDTLEFDMPAGWNIIGYTMGQSLANNPVTQVGEGYTITPYVHTTGSIAAGWHVQVDFKSAYAAGAVRLASEAFFMDFIIYSKPTCATPDTAIRDWHYSGLFTDYPDTINKLRFDLIGKTLFQYNSTQKPVLNLQNNTGAVQGVQPQQIWDVQLNNTGSYVAPNLWMALEDGSSSINIDSVVLMPSNVVLSPISYGSGNKMYQVSAAGLAGGGSSQQARVYFKYTNCTPDSIKVLMGYDCDAFPADPATACTSGFQYLKVMPANSQVQLSIERQPGDGSSISLCTTDSVIAVVNSAEAGNLVAPYINVYPPAGATIQTPVAIEYPVGSGNYQNAAVTAITGGYKVDLTAHTGIGANGLPGTVMNPSVPGRQARVKINFTTTCGITSGTSMTLSAFGTKPCGAVATGNGTSVQTSGMNIAGAATSGSAGMTIGLGTTSLTCGGTTTLTMSTVPVTTPTQVGDTVIYTLPAGLSYNGNFAGGSHCSSCTVSVTADPSGTTSVKVALETGIAAGTALGYSFDVVAAGQGCGALTIQAVAKRTIAPLVCGVTPCSGSSAIIGNTTSAPITISKPDIVLNNVAKLGNSNWYPGGTGNLSVAYTNAGTQDAAANSYQIEFFCGASATPFATRTLTHALLVNASATDTFILGIPAGICSVGDLITGKVQALTSSNISQCICNSQSFTIIGAPLPVRFTNAGIKADHCLVTLNWGYETSDVIVGFTAERSNDGRNWQKVASLKNSAISYSDVVPASGKWYYRIAASAADGTVSYSNTMMVTTSECTDSRITIYPNPAQDELQIHVTGTANIVYQYELVDALGRALLKGELADNSNTTVDIRAVSNGVYLLKITGDGMVSSRSVQIRR